MNDKDREKLRAAASADEAYQRGKLSRRTLLGALAAAGLGGAGLYSARRLLQPEPVPPAREIKDVLGPRSASVPGTDEHRFLKEVGRGFAGKKLRIVTESTPPSVAIKGLVATEFTPLTGIEVEWEMLPLDRVLAMVIADTARQAGETDIFYWDQAWIGRFAEESVPPEEMFQKKDLAYPGYDFDDIMKPLVENIASYDGRVAAIPYDIPIFAMIYRRDVLEELKLEVPRTVPQFMSCARAIQEAKAPGIYGAVGQWQSGHYSLECDMTMWLWAHGGSVFGADERPTINDENAVRAMEYMLELRKFMHPKSSVSNWDGQVEHFLHGEAGLCITWVELFPVLENSVRSKIAGLVEVAPCPAPLALRPKSACGFDETPGVSHQGGASLAISKYTRNKEAAWVFLQWATSPDITARACVLGGGASPIRRSNYEDPRVKACATGPAATTRHFDVVKEAILSTMGTEPHLPAWARLSVESFAVELGKMITGQQNIKTTLDKMASDAAKAALADKKAL